MAEFYVLSNDKKLVAAQYLRDRGTRIVDPNPNATKYVLRDRNGKALADQNVGNYYIVPAGYSLDDARRFGDHMRANGGEKPSIEVIGSMRNAFWTGGSQDWQRRYTYADGTPGDTDDPVPAFRRSTSFILGFVTARSGIPLEMAELGGAALNRMNEVRYFLLQHFLDDKDIPDIDTDGAYGNNPENARSIEHGFVHSKANTASWDRADLHKQRNVVVAERGPARLDRTSLNNARPRMQSSGRDVQLASYRFGPSDDATVTPAAALREIERVKADDAFGKRYVKGERDAVDYLHALHRVVYPEPTDEGGQNGPDRTSPNMAGGTATGHAPWFGKALATNEAREAGADPTLAGWRNDPRRRRA